MGTKILSTLVVVSPHRLIDEITVTVHLICYCNSRSVTVILVVEMDDGLQKVRDVGTLRHEIIRRRLPILEAKPVSKR